MSENTRYSIRYELQDLTSKYRKHQTPHYTDQKFVQTRLDNLRKDCLVRNVELVVDESGCNCGQSLDDCKS